MSDTLIQRARDIAADQYIRLEVKRPTPLRTLEEWAPHVAAYSDMIRQGSFDRNIEVQTALAVLRSVA
ncbi:hypothetical protein AQZ52_11085 [Novosphingobium fuchskuhlense]|uniref:Uncharacterized protein n=1 Tax=Novosphingobium fuchskuhlense TaxID=1117702 RepID=A0A124JUG2_9SPHN|nr:hypothetical protein [Novosphingobium fuchskuhlense]KUR71207.1 hypothetical protein AQZ52_11085 [Novosphingobium fuchskuhlense]